MGAISLLNVGVAAAAAAEQMSITAILPINHFMASSPGSPGLWHNQSPPSWDATQVCRPARRRAHPSNPIPLRPAGAYRNRRCDCRFAQGTELFHHWTAPPPRASLSLQPDEPATASDRTIQGR